MKKLFMILSVVGLMTFATANVYAQDAEAVATEQVAEDAEAVAEEPVAEEPTFEASADAVLDSAEEDIAQ